MSLNHFNQIQRPDLHPAPPQAVAEELSLCRTPTDRCCHLVAPTCSLQMPPGTLQNPCPSWAPGCERSRQPALPRRGGHLPWEASPRDGAQTLGLPEDILLMRTVTFIEASCLCRQGRTNITRVDARCYSRELTTHHNNESKAKAEKKAGNNFCQPSQL